MSGDGVVAHNRRTYFAENVDPTRTRLNVEYCYTPIEEAYHQLFDAALSEFNAKQKRKDRCIENYYEKIRDGKQEKPFYEVIFQVGNKDDMGTVGENAELAKTILDKFYRSFLERNAQGGRYASLEVLNDVVQEFINQIVFLRICEDKNLPLYHKLKPYLHR